MYPDQELDLIRKQASNLGKPTVETFLDDMGNMLVERGQGYDNDEERSMTATTRAFNAVTGRTGNAALSESEAYQFMMCLKMVRQNTCPKHDNVLDAACYAALWGELSLKEGEK